MATTRPAVITRTYDPKTQRYETAQEYEKRLRDDLALSVKRIQKETHAPQTVTLRKEEVSVERTPLDGNGPVSATP